MHAFCLPPGLMEGFACGLPLQDGDHVQDPRSQGYMKNPADGQVMVAAEGEGSVLERF
jgi:hypothetical protein